MLIINTEGKYCFINDSLKKYIKFRFINLITVMCMSFRTVATETLGSLIEI